MPSRAATDANAAPRAGPPRSHRSTPRSAPRALHHRDGPATIRRITLFRRPISTCAVHLPMFVVCACYPSTQHTVAGAAPLRLDR